MTPALIELTVEIILKLRSLPSEIPFKEIIQTYLTTEDKGGVIKTSRRYWGGPIGWPSTLIVLKAIRKLVCKTTYGRNAWKIFILSEAKHIVNTEASRRWRGHHYPPHVSARAVNARFFDSTASEQRTRQIRTGMDFLFQLIRHRLSVGRPETELDSDELYLSNSSKRKSKESKAAEPKLSVSEGSDPGSKDNSEKSNSEKSVSGDSSLSEKSCAGSESEDDGWTEDVVEDTGLAVHSSVSGDHNSSVSDDHDNQANTDEADQDRADGDEDDWVDTKQGVTYVKPGQQIAQLKLRFDNTASTVCSMIAFVSNRSVNGLQLENGVALLAGGVSQRINHYLHSIGLTCSRQSAMRAISQLGQKGLRDLKARVSKDYVIRPFMILDNFDIQERIHYSRLEANSRMFHGTYGYMHFLSQKLVSKVDPKELTLTSLVKAMRDAEDLVVHAKYLLPDVPERAHWTKTTKAQLGQAYLDYIATEDRTVTPKVLPKIACTPPQVEQIPIEKADIIMLPLMEFSCGSSEGVGQVLDHVSNVTGRSLKEFPDDLQVVEGDVGTCINLESYRSKLHPAGNRHESMINYLTLPGAAHTMWNVGQWQVLGGWGNAEDLKDLPYSKGWEALTGKAVWPAIKKDFGVIMRIIYHLHFASLVWCMRQVIKKRSGSTDILDTETANSIIEETHSKYFTEAALQSALETGDIRGYNLRLRLRDLATYVEADQAAKIGDIGRLIQMWKRWSIMAHGNTGLSHYAQHLPRLVLLLEHYLPKGLAHVIKHSMLISARGVSGKFV